MIKFLMLDFLRRGICPAFHGLMLSNYGILMQKTLIYGCEMDDTLD